MFRNFKAVEKTAFGRGSFEKLGEIVAPHRNSGAGYLIFFVDEYFEGDEAFKARIPLESKDHLEYIPVSEEPTTELIDSLRDKYLDNYGLPAGVVGTGGGSVLDVARRFLLCLPMKDLQRYIRD